MKPSSQPSSLSDLLALGETVLTTLLGAGKEIKSHAQDKRDSVVRKLDLVTREEFDAAFAMIKKARAAQSDLEKRLTQIEKKMSVSSPQKRAGKKQIRAKK